MTEVQTVSLVQPKMADNVDEHSGMSKNSSDSRFLQIDHDEIQHMHLFNSASFNTNNDNNNVNEAKNENVDKVRQVGGASVNQPSINNIPDVYQISLQNQLLMQNVLHNQKNICAKYER